MHSRSSFPESYESRPDLLFYLLLKFKIFASKVVPDTSFKLMTNKHFFL
jgi:hypothetical protein